MKKLINAPRQVVEEMTQGMLAAYPDLARVSGYTVLVRADAAAVRERQVALVSGGGSGHEPAHAGYVGPGMLSAAVAGEVFTSPSSDSVLAAIRAVAGAPGVLLIVKNYTGDRLNFGLAAEMARAEGIAVEVVVVADDVALAATLERETARGIAGTVLVHKVAGAAAAEGQSLSEVARVARETSAAVASMGVSLSAGTVPAIGKPGFTLEETEVELGLGIHGEPGAERVRMDGADGLTDRLVEDIAKVRHLQAGDDVVLLINNLGASTTMELAIVARRAVSNLRSRNVNVKRVLMGTFLSSLEMSGVSISLLRVDEERLRLLDSATGAPAWPNVSGAEPTAVEERTIAVRSHAAVTRSRGGEKDKRVVKAVEAACEALLNAREQLTELDRVVGDGDLGITLGRGAEAVLEALPGYPGGEASDLLYGIGETLQQVLGGSSGPLYGVLFLRAASSLQGKGSGDMAAWAAAFGEACEAVSEMGGARVGDRTMLDALVPFAETLRREAVRGMPVRATLDASVSAAEDGARATADLMPRRGRSSYLGERALGHADPGAIAATLWLRAIATTWADEKNA